jgi:hypothetical protein
LRFDAQVLAMPAEKLHGCRRTATGDDQSHVGVDRRWKPLRLMQQLGWIGAEECEGADLFPGDCRILLTRESRAQLGSQTQTPHQRDACGTGSRHCVGGRQRIGDDDRLGVEE